MNVNTHLPPKKATFYNEYCIEELNLISDILFKIVCWELTILYMYTLSCTSTCCLLCGLHYVKFQCHSFY